MEANAEKSMLESMPEDILVGSGFVNLGLIDLLDLFE